MSKYKLNPKIALFIDVSGIRYINLVVVDFSLNILELATVSKINSLYLIRKNFMTVLNELLQKHPVDTIIMEQNRLFIDKIDRYPDPLVLRDVQLGFGIRISVEDKYWSDKILLEIPDYEWKNKVLNTTTKYAIDLYKAHILERQLDKTFLEQIDELNYYKVLCFSESILYDTLMHKKYQINKK